MTLGRIRIDNKVAIITGAGRGVGKGIATTFAEAGAKIVGCARTQVELDRTIKEINDAGGDAIGVVADVMKRDDLKRVTDEAYRRHGRIDILVNNAGGQDFKAFLDLSEEEFKYHFDWNTTSAFLLSQLVAPYMIEQGDGVILNVSSGASHIAIRGMMAFCVAKAGLDHLTRCLAQELAPKIRANCIALGAVMTPPLQDLFDLDPSFKEKLLEKTPLKAVGDVIDIAIASLYLCSPAARFVTGAILHTDGGLQDTNLPFRLADL
jgi:7-alpha-hydroxysteroid dehydrogenase